MFMRYADLTLSSDTSSGLHEGTQDHQGHLSSSFRERAINI